MKDETLDLTWRLLRLPGFLMLFGYAGYNLTILESQLGGLRAVGLGVAVVPWMIATMAMEARAITRDLDAWSGGPFVRSRIGALAHRRLGSPGHYRFLRWLLRIPMQYLGEKTMSDPRTGTPG